MSDQTQINPDMRVRLSAEGLEWKLSRRGDAWRARVMSVYGSRAVVIVDGTTSRQIYNVRFLEPEPR